jgi:hypothetical protein
MKSRKPQKLFHRIEPLESRSYLSSSISFAAKTDFSAGTSPVALATADLNADGKADLAVADSASDSVLVYLGNGAGAFTAGAVLKTSSPPEALIAADFNGDGVPDIAALCGPTSADPAVTVQVFLNTGNDTFSTVEVTNVIASAAASDPVAFTSGDFNGDKKLDLAVTDYTGETVNVLMGNNTGLFGVPVVYTGDSNPTAIVAAEFTGGTVDDLAITTETPDPMTGIQTKNVSLLDNDGAGNFSIGQNLTLGTSTNSSAIAAADVTGAGATDLVVGNTDSTASVLLNTGGSFELSSSPPLSAGSTAIAVADFDLDGTPDLVSANGGTSSANSGNSISIIPGIGGGEYAAAENFPTGTQPDAVVVADFNNDGRPDVATANTAAGTVSILLNNTVVPTVATRSVLTSAQASAPAGTSVDLTATITPTSTSPLIGEKTPTGTVNFYDGNTLIGSATIAAGTDQAVFAETSLTVGPHHLTAAYLGDVGYATSNSPAIAETITPTATQGPDLVSTYVSGSMPATAVPGETGTIRVKVTNQGNSLASGLITNGLYFSVDTTLDSSDLPVAMKGNLAKTNVHLNPNQSTILTGTYTVPAGIPLATYYPLVWIDQTGSLAESNATNNVVAAPTAFSVLNAFGDVSGRANIVLQISDDDGTTGTFRLTGPGNGTVNVSDDGLQVLLDGTTAASVLTVTIARGSIGALNVSTLTADSAVGTIRAPNVAISDSVSLPNGAVALTIGSIGYNSDIVLGAGPATALSLGSVNGTTLTAASGIRSLAVTSWSGTSIDSITAPWIGTITSKGGFGSALTLSGTGAPAGVALQSATINGPVGSNAWVIGGAVNRLKTGSIPRGWTGSVTGAVGTFTDSGNFAGQFAAASFSSVAITGDLTDADILAGATFGAAGSSVLSNDTFGTGKIGTVNIRGTVSNAVIAAGLIPSSTTALISSSASLADGSSIRSVSIAGSVDDNSRILADNLPKTARLGGTAVDPATDPRCELNG